MNMNLKNNKTLFFALILGAASIYSCKKDAELIDNQYQEGSEKVDDKPYSNGFFVITEGSLARTSGTINFYHYGDDTVRTYAYEKENPGKMTSNASKSSTLQFASMIDGKIYLLSKMNGPIVKLDANTLKEEARNASAGLNWRSILQINGDAGLVSASDGVYHIDLSDLTVGGKVSGFGTSNSGDMIKRGNQLFVLQSTGTKVVSAVNYAVLKSNAGVKYGFAQTPNGKIWGSTGARLIAFDENLDTAGIKLPANVGSFGLDAPTRITASTKENAVFYHSGKKIYKYIDGDLKSLEQPFITIDIAPFMVYGVVRYDRNKDYLVVNGIQGYGVESEVNYCLIYNASTGELVKQIKYGEDGVGTPNFNHIYFPDLTIFN